MKNIIISLILLLVFPLASAMEDVEHPKKRQWPFEGIFGTFDRQSAQRGYQVYREVCATCHSMKGLYYRNLTALGFSEAEVKAIASEYQIKDGPNDEGEMFERPGLPSDRFAAPYPNEQAARAANGGQFPVDLTLIIKARHDGPNYLYSLLTGYQEEPQGLEVPEGGYYNPYFPGKVIGMPQPLSDGQVSYADGTEASLDQMSKDIVNFLQWTAEPEMEARKAMGIKVILYLTVLSVLFYRLYKKTWQDVK